MYRESNSVTDEDIKEKPDGIEEFVGAILGLAVLPLVIAHWITPHLASRPAIWRLKEIKKRHLIFAIFASIPLNLLFMYLIYKSGMNSNWVLAGFLFIFFWASLLPLAAAIS